MPQPISKVSLLIGVALLVATIPRPANASCVEPYRIDTGTVAGQQGGPYLVSNPEWRGAGGDQSCTFGYGCYDTECGPPISPDLFGLFWALGSGDPIVGIGDDNGAWTVSGWSKQSSADQNGGQPLPGGLYHYPAWLTRPATPPVALPNSVAGYPIDWADELVDGCVANAGATPEIDGTECTCVLLNDQWRGEGCFGLLAAQVSEFDNFDLAVDSAIHLAPIPPPRIMGTERTADYDMVVDVLADPVTEGVSQVDGCECGLGYKVYAYLLRRGSLPPVDRVEGWHEPLSVTGDPQTITPLGEQTTITVDCDETTQQDFFLSIRLVTDDGFATRLGSVNSFRIECALGCSGLDRDGDSFSVCAGDCDDSDPAVNPGEPEVCNAIDDNCDGAVDEDELGEDTDDDGVRNLCDNCRDVVNPIQADADDDGAGDSCDNCPDDRNPTQSDADGDDEGDVCDLNDGMIYIRFHQPGYVEWQEEDGYTQWNCYRGDLALLRSSGIYTQDPIGVNLVDRYCAENVAWVLDPDPPPAEAVFFLTTGLYPESGLGTTSGGEARLNSNPCP